jgi:hypothetical protein
MEMPRRHTTVARELRTIQTALRNIQQSLGRLAPLITSSAEAKNPKRQITITPKRRAALKLQGQYMGLMRGLKPAQKAKVKRIKAARGVRPAIAEAKRLLK